jgi:nicotinate phosphoribosyltransferase
MTTFEKKAIITSILDNDLYKFTMMQGAWRQYRNLVVEYTFTNRGQTPFPKNFGAALRWQIKQVANLRLTDKEYTWLKTSENTQFFRPEFIELLRTFKLRAKDVTVRQRGNKVTLSIKGPWFRTILWEVPLLALISELYFQMTGQKADEDTFTSRLETKTRKLVAAGAKFAEFGTRRRFSQAIQERVVAYFAKNAKSSFIGTSNMYLAMKYDIKPIGTQAHEWFMAHQAMFGTVLANQKGLESWLDEYDGDLGIALSDTFTTDVFFKTFTKALADAYDGLRWDSGDADEFTLKAKAFYDSINIDSQTKSIVYSDSLNDDRAIELLETFNEMFIIAFGIGTYFTNDVGVKPLNIVIKLFRCWVDGELREVVKLSDTPGKNNGTQEAIAQTLQDLDLVA